ncbi:MAG TPA: FecR family protein [Planctomycetota bacterium]|nr:FecR family protein [Planctomycetota bacterium]
MPPDAMPPEIEMLWEEFLSGKLDAAESSTLLAWLERHPQCLAQKRREAALSAALGYLLGSPAASSRLVESVQSRIDGTPAGKKSGRFKKSVLAQIDRRSHKHQRRSRKQNRFSRDGISPLGIAAAVAVLLLGAILIFSARQAPIPQPTVTKTEPVKQASPQRDQATVTVLTGEVTVDGTRVSGKVAVQAGSQIRAEASGRARLTLEDNSAFELAESTTLTLQEPRNGPRVLLTSGIIGVNASPQPAGTNLQIETSHATVNVIGTQFTVHAAKTQSWVGVEHGKVMVSADGKQASLTAGEELVASGSGLSEVRKSGASRLIALNQAKVEVFTDPVTLEPLAGKSFRGMPLQRFAYKRPAKDALGYGGAFWTPALSPGEESFEIWIRPLRIEPIPRDFNLLKLCLMLNCGETQYLLGEIEVRPEDNEWMRLEGSFDKATVNWTRPGAAPEPLKTTTANEIALRVIMGEAVFEHSPIRVFSKKR